MLGFGPIADSPVAAEPDRWGQPPIGWKTTASLWGSAGFGYAFPAGPATAVANGMRFDWANSFSADPTSSQLRGFYIPVRAGYRYTLTVAGDGTGSGPNVQAEFAFIAGSGWQSPSSMTPMVVYYDATSNGIAFVGVAAAPPANATPAGANFTVASFSVTEVQTVNATFTTNVGGETADGGSSTFTGGSGGGGSATRVGGAANSVDTTGTLTLTLPAYGTADGVVIVHAVRSSVGNSLTSMSDSSGATWTVRDGPTSANSSSAHYTWTAPWTSAMSGATVTIVFSGTNQTSAVAEVWENVAYDTIQTPTTSGAGSTITHTAGSAGGSTDVVVLAFGAGRSPTSGAMGLSAAPAGYTNSQATNSVRAGSVNNTYAFSASLVQNSSTVASASSTLTASANSRFGTHVTFLGVGSGNATFSTSTGSGTADAGSTSITGDAAFVGSLGGESAAGGSSTLSGDATFTTSAGGESAAGGSSAYTGDAAFATNVSSDTASGGSTSFSGSGSPDATFDTVAGGESAAGGSSSFTGDGLFSTAVATAPADGGSTTVTGGATFATAVSADSASGGSSTFTGTGSPDGTFATTVGAGTADGGSTTFYTVVRDATFWSTTTLSWAPPDTTGWTVRTVNATENPVTLNDSTDYVIQFSATRTATLDIRGGRNIVIRNPRIGGRKTAPALTSSYDGPNRGLRIQDGANANNDRTIWIEGLWVEPGTYQSDTIQVALRTENRVKIVIQNFNDLGINWGNNVTSPNVHADALQTYGGPTTLWVDGMYAAHCTYQGIIINPDDGRTAPTGTPENWIFRRVHLAGDNLTGNGVRYLLWNSLPAGWNIVQDEVFTTGSTRNVTDSTAKWPASSELRQQTQPPYDIVCQGLWDDSGIYTSPGYVTATASGGVTSFTNSPVSVFSTNTGEAAAVSGGDTSFVASSPGTSVTFTTLADVNTASGGTAVWAVVSPQDAFFVSNVANAQALGNLGNLIPGVLLGYRVDLFIERPRTRLFGTYEGLTAYKKDGVWSITTSPQDDVLASADYVVRGGYDTVVSQAVGEELLGQGYGTLTPVYGP